MASALSGKLSTASIFDLKKTRFEVFRKCRVLTLPAVIKEFKAAEGRSQNYRNLLKPSVIEDWLEAEERAALPHQRFWLARFGKDRVARWRKRWENPVAVDNLGTTQLKDWLTEQNQASDLWKKRYAGEG